MEADLVPVRMTYYVTLAETVEEYDAGRHFEMFDDFVDTLAGVFGEGGSSAVMDTADVIPGSPLDEHIKLYTAATGRKEVTDV